MTTTDIEKTRFKVVGTRPVRHDGIEKVTGQALYGADIDLNGLLHGKVLRSPHAHARVVSIDTSRAESLAGVQAVITGDDLTPAGPMQRGGGNRTDAILAQGKVLYKGHPVAAVAASSPTSPRRLLSLSKWTTSRCRPSRTSRIPSRRARPFSTRGGTIPPTLFPARRSTRRTPQCWSATSWATSKGFAEADLIVEREFRTKTVHQGYIEPQNGTASWSPEGRLTIWCSSQGHFGIRDAVAGLLDVPISRVKVVPMEIGGGFGGKLTAYLEPLAALLSKKSGRPVKMTMTRAEVLEASGPTAGSHVTVKIGVTNEGRITAAFGKFLFEGGAYGGGPVAPACAAIFAPYNIENVLIDGYDIVTNKPSTRAYRAPGAPIVAFATESVIDEIADMLDIDPMELRLLNAAREGYRRADGVMNGRIGAVEVMEAVRSHPHYGAPKQGANHGRGVSMGFCRNNTGPASVIANVLDDGTVSLVEGSVDIGGSRTVIAQQLAEVLGIPVEDVNPSIGDTDSIGFTSNTGGSGVAFKSGWAAHEAARDVIAQLTERAAMIWDVSPDQVRYEDGGVEHVSDTELRMSFREIAAMLPDSGGPVVGRANLNPAGQSGSYSANIVDVEVDPDTGKVDILRYTAFQDVGFAIHPSYVEGQIQGGTAQGVGWALNEEYFMSDDGAMLNTSLLDYRMPTTLDLPMIDTVLVEVNNPGHPFGVRGVGEANISPPMAALANAIHDAVGLRLSELPMNPQAVSKAIREKAG